MDTRQYLISDARKEQIIKAAIQVLAEKGHKNTSLSKIAKKANISTGLISYHFSDKEDLMKNTLIYLVLAERTYIKDKLEVQETQKDKLVTFIEASLAYQSIYPENNIAMLEIVFNGRTEDNTPYYLAEVESEDELNSLLKQILDEGKRSKEFNDFNTNAAVIIIRGAISGSMLSHPNENELEKYSKNVIENILKMVK